MNNDLFYIGLKGVFCFKEPYPQLCEVIAISNQLAILVQIGAIYRAESLSNRKLGATISPYNPPSENSSMLSSIYNFTTDNIVSGSSLNGFLIYKAGAGNSTTAIFAGGGSSGRVSDFTNISSLYNYSSNLFSFGTNLPYPFTAGGATSNQVVAIIGGGLGNVSSQQVYDISNPSNLGDAPAYQTGPISNTCLYTYSTNTAVNSTNLTTQAILINAVGNSTVAIFGLGGNNISYYDSYPEGVNSNGCIYTYANAAVGNSFSFFNFEYGEYDTSAAAGNSTQAIFVRNGGGYSGVNYYSLIYNYSTSSIAEGQNLSEAAMIIPGTGTSTVAIFGSGNSENNSYFTTTLYNYSYSSGTFTEGKQLTFGNNADSAACNSNIGVNA